MLVNETATDPYHSEGTSAPALGLRRCLDTTRRKSSDALQFSQGVSASFMGSIS